MKYVYTPEEAWSTADSIAGFLTKRKFKVSVETPISKDVPLRTTLVAKRSGLLIMVEAQHKPKCDDGLIALAHFLQNEMHYCELYIAADENANFPGTFLKQLDKNGIGLLVVDANEQVTVIRAPKNPALAVYPDPTLRYGSYKEKVNTCLQNFNSPNSSLTTTNPRKEALSEMYDIVEALTKELAFSAVKTGLVKLTKDQIEAKDWSGIIDTLASKNAYHPGKTPLISDNLKLDLHSFRGARNLLKHPAKSKQDEAKRQKQFAERIIMGARIVADLVSIRSTVLRRKSYTPISK